MTFTIHLSADDSIKLNVKQLDGLFLLFINFCFLRNFFCVFVLLDLKYFYGKIETSLKQRLKMGFYIKIEKNKKEISFLNRKLQVFDECNNYSNLIDVDRYFIIESF